MDNKTRCSVLCRGFQGAQRRAEETGHSSFFFGVEKKGRTGGNVNAGKNTRGALDMPRKTDQSGAPAICDLCLTGVPL